MRLAQLARKLSVKPSQIVDLLSQDQVFFEEGSNAKLNDDLVKQVVLHFAPERILEIMQVQATEAEAIEQESKFESSPLPSLEVKAEPTAIEAISSSQGAEPTETIRVKKVELAGLKVVGKIDLPQPRQKEENKEEEAASQAKPKRERKEKYPRRDRDEKLWRNPIALQREAEAREREERRQESLRQQKERKRLHYLNRVKNNKPPKAARIYEEATHASVEVVAKKPQTWIGKFLRWLNT